MGAGAWTGSDVIAGNLKPLIRFNDHFNMILSATFTVRRNSLGYVTKTDNGAGGDQIIFGSRFRQDLETSIAANYLFTNKISLTLRVRHYWAVVDYNQFYLLQTNGTMGDAPYTGEHDANYNAFNVDLIFRWRFAPRLRAQCRLENAVLDNGTNPNYSYFSNFGRMFETGQNNQFSIKVLYYLDFFKLFKNKNQGKRLE